VKPSVQSLGDHLARTARAVPDQVALEWPGGSLTYAELFARADAAAALLAGRGARPGDRVALLLPAGPAFAEAFWGALRLGAIAMPVDLRLGEAERAAQVESAAVVVDERLTEGGHAHAEGSGPKTCMHVSGPDPVACTIHTSGTAGASKPVELTHGNFVWSAFGSAVALGLDRGDRWLCPLPLSHVGGLSILVRSAIYGTTAVLHDGWDTERVARSMSEERITLVSLVPTMVARLVEHGVTAPALRTALIGGGPLPAPVAERAKAAGLPVAQTYGLTEACSQVTTSAPGEPETAGPPLACTRVEIAEDGEILVASPTVAPGAVAADGFLHTGDRGELDERGRLVVTGRKADTIVTGGENVAPTEVEAALLAHPAVAEAAVHGRPDERWGEAVVAKVVLRTEADPAEIREHARARLAGFKVPKAVEVVDELPRTASGKIIRRYLR
jgi:o-succinylbenzoate---CoA ligase